MILIPNMDKPTRCGECELRALDEWEDEYCVILKSDISVPYERMPDCSLIEIAELTETLKHDIRKLIAFIEPRMIIASTYDEQIERAEAVKNWLMSIVGERRTDE